MIGAEIRLGQVFDRWTVRNGPQLRKGRAHYFVQCLCGVWKWVAASTLLNHTSRSCGCFAREQLRHANITHGESKRTRLYVIWQGMLARCYNPKQRCYTRYGGRGIHVYASWRTSYVDFREWAYVAGYKDGLTLDRRDNNGPYIPENCRWVDYQGQANNKSTNKLLQAFGETKTAADWLRDIRCQVKTWPTLQKRLHGGWEVEYALTKPADVRPPHIIQAFGCEQTLSAWGRDPRCVVGRRTLERRLKKGWTVEDALTVSA